MRKNRVRSILALAAAGALGLAGAAPPYPASAPAPGVPVSGWRANATPGGNAVPLSPSHACLVEMQVELAWLADSLTFPHPMAARIMDTSLEIGGVVPTESVRQRAVYLARECSGMKVADRLHVQPGPPQPPVHVAESVLARNASGAVSGLLA